MPLRDWGRAWDVLYWSGVVVSFLTGLVVPIRLGVALLGFALFLAVLAPVRDRPRVFWPVIVGYLGFAGTFIVTGVLVGDPPIVPTVLGGLVLAGLATVIAHRLILTQERTAQERRDGRS